MSAAALAEAYLRDDWSEPDADVEPGGTTHGIHC